MISKMKCHLYTGWLIGAQLKFKPNSPPHTHTHIPGEPWKIRLVMVIPTNWVIICYHVIIIQKKHVWSMVPYKITNQQGNFPMAQVAPSPSQPLPLRGFHQPRGARLGGPEALGPLDLPSDYVHDFSNPSRGSVVWAHGQQRTGKRHTWPSWNKNCQRWAISNPLPGMS